MQLNPCLWMSVWLACSVISSAQQGRNDPRIGYLSPAGASRNSTVEILAGGQNLRSMSGVRVSGNGVEARIIKSYRQVRNLDGDQRALLNWRIACRRADIHGKPHPPKPKGPPPTEEGKPAPEVKLPDHPMLDLLDQLGLPEIEHGLLVMQRQDRMQQNNQLGELIRVELRISADATPGMRELRLMGVQGLSNPLRFEVSTLPEIREYEPNEPKESGGIIANLPCIFNGQIQSGDVDVFRFRAERGRNLIVRGQARALIPYLADAVPGWFQMVVTLRDAKGREVAYADDFGFDPDPMFCWKVPETGEYALEIRDSIYRGREDFVYRVSIGETPFVTSVFPLGGRKDEPLTATLRGWNLPSGEMKLSTSGDGDTIRNARTTGRLSPSNTFQYAIDQLTEFNEAESTTKTSEPVNAPFPCVINGRIDQAGDADVFRVEGRKGVQMLVEVQARRLRSPLDSVVHIADESGRVLAWNDDSMEKDGHLHLGEGLLTHHADSKVLVTPTSDGPLDVRIADTQLHGGPEFSYRLRISEVRPDFELRVTPSVLNIGPGGHTPLRVHVLRNEGFEGPIDLQLEGAPDGFKLSGAQIPAGQSQVRITLSTPENSAAGVFTPRLVGTAGSVRRTASAADDMMQAFLWRHLVPTDEWIICVAPGRGKRSTLEFASAMPVLIPSGAGSTVKVKIPKWIVDRALELETSEAPSGITLSSIRMAHGVAEFDVKADASMKAGFETNLIIEVFATKQAPNKPALKGQRIPIANLPAIPIQITPPNPS